MFKKNVVLTGIDNLSQRALLTIECDGERAKGNLRLYNFSKEPDGIISLGIYQDGGVIKAGLTRVSQMLYNFQCQASKIQNDFSCAVINFVDGEPTPILFGNGDGYADGDEIYMQIIDELNDAKNVENVENTLDKYGVEYEPELKAEIEDDITKCLQEDEHDCENCIYKKYYFENNNSQSLSLGEQNNIEEDEKEENKQFYLELKPQLDSLFENNPNEEYLENLIPNSKWVKVNIDDGDNYYVLGLIYEEDNLKYICYGVPGVYQKFAPRELSGYPVWFPLEESKPQGFGYWLSYQDAESGESVKAVVV